MRVGARPTVRRVEQQALVALHRIRGQWMTTRTAPLLDAPKLILAWSEIDTPWRRVAVWDRAWEDASRVTSARWLSHGAGVVAGLWFAYEIRYVLLISLFVVVLSIVMNAPVTWLEDRRVNRVVATLLVFASVLTVMAFLTWLVLPRVAAESRSLLDNLPEYVSKLRDVAAGAVGEQSELARSVQEQIPSDVSGATELLPPATEILTWISRYSLSLITGLALLIILVALVGYIVVRPRPLLELYLHSFPERLRGPAARAFSRASAMCVGWRWSNIVAGAIEAVLVAVVLGYLGVPGVAVWAALAFFAELVPKIGAYIMGVPPTLVALAVSPVTALWVVLFYVAMNEIVGNFVIPRIRTSTMDMHASSVMFMMLAMAAGFGLAGALIATPMAAFIKAYYDEFYLARREPLDRGHDEQIERMLRRAELPGEA